MHAALLPHQLPCKRAAPVTFTCFFPRRLSAKADLLRGVDRIDDDRAASHEVPAAIAGGFGQNSR
jgi:hypothetical protein